MKVLFFLALLLPFSASATRLGPQDGGGGDTDAADFVDYARRLGEWGVKHAEKISPADAAALSAVTQKIVNDMDGGTRAPVVFISEALHDEFGTPKMALFQKEPLLIRVQRDPWRLLSTLNKFKLVALETFGAAGIDARYAKSRLVEDNFGDIAGNAAVSSSDLVRNGSPVLNALYGKGAYGEEFDFWNRAYRSEQFGEPRYVGDSNEGMITGHELFGLESEKLSRYQRALGLFREFPKQYQFDILASGCATFLQDPEPHSWGRSDVCGLNLTSTKILATKLVTYLEQLDEAIDSLRRGQFKPARSATAEKKLAALAAKTERALRLVSSASVKHLNERLEFSGRDVAFGQVDFVQNLLENLRSTVEREGCEVPTTFEANQAMRDWAKKSPKITYPATDSASAARAGEAAERAIEEILNGIYDLKATTKLDDAVASGLFFYKGGDGQVTNAEFLALMAKSLAAATNANARDEAALLLEMTNSASDGTLCHKWAKRESN